MNPITQIVTTNPVVAINNDTDLWAILFKDGSILLTLNQILSEQRNYKSESEDGDYEEQIEALLQELDTLEEVFIQPEDGDNYDYLFTGLHNNNPNLNRRQQIVLCANNVIMYL